jgi:hypothetical protein
MSRQLGTFAPNLRGRIREALWICITASARFGKPLASFQVIQQRLMRMLADVTAMHPASNGPLGFRCRCSCRGQADGLSK